MADEINRMLVRVEADLGPYERALRRMDAEWNATLAKMDGASDA